MVYSDRDRISPLQQGEHFVLTRLFTQGIKQL
jgi:hypothetical protein